MEHNGYGNPKLVGFSGDREVIVTLQDAIWDNKAIAMLTGNDLVEGAVDISRYDELVVSTVTDGEDNESGEVELTKTPKEISAVFVMNADGTLGQELEEGTDFTVTGNTVSLSSVTEGRVAVYYIVTSGETAKTIKVTSDQFGQTFRVTIDCLVRDEFTKQDFAAQIEIPNAKFEDNFNLSLAVDGDPAVLDLNMEALKDPNSTDMWLLHIYDEEDIA